MAQDLPFGRVLLKLSGEALLGGQDYGVDPAFVGRIADELIAARALGVDVGIVVGGGNIFRGFKLEEAGGDRVVGDQMGMLATVMNGLALYDALRARGQAAALFSGLPVPTVCATFTQRDATAAFDDGKVVVFAGGTGNPFFTTDTGAALRAAEMRCDALMKGTMVDGVYSADPHKVPGAERFDRLSYDEVLERGLKVMDAAAIAIARDNGLPVVVFSILQTGGFVDILRGRGRATVVSGA